MLFTPLVDFVLHFTTDLQTDDKPDTQREVVQTGTSNVLIVGSLEHPEQ